MTSRRAPARLVIAVLTLAVGLAMTVAPARAQDGCAGVRVVVDATALGAGMTVRCAAGDPETGLEALRDAGHSYTFVPRQPGLVCTIDARPDPCNGAPTDAYWSYWHAPAGGSWTYSTRGAGNRDPEPGTVEGWAFGAGDPPREPPPPAAAEDPEAEPNEEPTAEAGPAAGSADTSSGEEPTGDDEPTSPAAGAPSPADAGVTTPAPTAAAIPASPDASPSALDAPPGPVEPATASPTPSPIAGDVIPSGGGGAPVGLLAGGLLIAGLAGAGVAQARRRDRG